MATTPFATTQELAAMFRTLTTEETTRATTLLAVVSDSMRMEAKYVGKDIDAMITADTTGAYQNVVKSVCCDVTARMLMTPTDTAPQTQYSESALGYTVSGQFLVPGGGIFIKKSELARLGLRRQRNGVIDLC